MEGHAERELKDVMAGLYAEQGRIKEGGERRLRKVRGRIACILWVLKELGYVEPRRTDGDMALPRH